jgi:hypothetical protein
MRTLFIAAIFISGIAVLTLESQGQESSSTKPTTQPAGAVAKVYPPPWLDLNPRLTDEQIRQMPTADLAEALFAGGVPARVMMASNTGPINGIARLVAEYPGYREFFDRPDCWKGLVGMIDSYAAQLNLAGDDIKNVNATVGLTNLQTFFEYPKIQDQIKSHRHEIIDANLRALEKIRLHLNAAMKRQAAEEAQSTAGFAGMAAATLVQSTLKIESAINPDASKASAAAISRLKMDNQYRVEDVKNYISESLLQLKKFSASGG